MTRTRLRDLSLEDYSQPPSDYGVDSRARATRLQPKAQPRPRTGKPKRPGSRIAVGCAIAGALTIAIAAPLAQEYLQQQGQPKPRQTAPAATQQATRPKAAPAPTAPVRAQQAAAKPAAQDWATSVGDWSVKCVSAPTRLCQLSQRQLDPNTKGLLIWVELTQTADAQGNSALAVMTPLGMRLPPVLSIQADQSNLAGVPIVTCMQLGCLHSGPFAADSLAVLQRAQSLSTQITDMQNRTFAIQISTKGLSEASKAVNQFLRNS